jgi:hypothetical protein
VGVVTASQFFLDPLLGVTTLWKVAWLYSFVGGAVLQIIAIFVIKADASIEVTSLVCVAYGSYVTLALYRCASNCPWPFLGRLVRLCALISLIIVVPFAAYLILNTTT